MRWAVSLSYLSIWKRISEGGFLRRLQISRLSVKRVIVPFQNGGEGEPCLPELSYSVPIAYELHKHTWAPRSSWSFEDVLRPEGYSGTRALHSSRYLA